MTAVADLISRADRDRLAKRLAEWRELAGTMRKPGGMPAVPEPPALCQMAAARQAAEGQDRPGRTTAGPGHMTTTPGRPAQTMVTVPGQRRRR